MWKACLLIGFIVCCQNMQAIAQSSLSGRIINEQAEKVINANILLKTNNKIVAFTVSDHNGQFTLNYPENLERNKATVEINHISYMSKRFPFVTKIDTTITLLHKQNIIEEIRIGKPPAIRQNQDTVTYQVSSFSDISDKSIGEVLRKMPGFQVADNGKISYNGQSISNFYLDGDDLLGNRYGIGSKTIPHNIVATVEVYKNHQAIRALKDKFNSNEVAINLTIKENAKTEVIGELKAGVGTPNQFNIHLSNILLKSRLKMLNDIHWTSLEEDVEIATRDQVVDNRLNQMAPLLRTGITNVLDEPIGNFRKNSSLGLSSNLLIKTKSNWNTKINIGAYADQKHLQTVALQRYILVDTTITNAESTDIVFKPIQLDLLINLTKNINEFYLSNELAVSFKNYLTTDQITSGSFDIQERLQQQSYGVVNRTHFIPNSKSKNIWNFKWVNSFYDKPEKQRYVSDSALTVLSLFGQYDEATQGVRRPEFLSQLSADFTPQEWHGLYHTYGLENNVKLSQLKSNLLSINANQLDSIDISNQGDWSELKTNVYTQLQWNRKVIRFNTRIPVGAQYISIQDGITRNTNKRFNLIFTPSVSLRYLLSTKQQLKFLFSREQLFGKIEDVYSGVIMSDFRTLSSGLTIIPYTEKQNYQAGYALEFVEKMLFLNLQYNYSRSKLNLIHNLVVEENNTRSYFTEQDNLRTTNELKLTISKFINFLNGSSSVQFAYDANQTTQVINNILIPFNVSNLNIAPTIQGKIGTFLNWNYMSTLNWIKGENAIGLTSDEGTFLQRHSTQLTFTVTKRLFCSLQGTSFRLRNNISTVNLNFVNSSIRFAIKKPFSMEYELLINNILNQEENSSILIAPNMTFNRSYRLRGRTVLASALIPLSSLKRR